LAASSIGGTLQNAHDIHGVPVKVGVTLWLKLESSIQLSSLADIFSPFSMDGDEKGDVN
jgi:hypothetical protein